MKFRGIPARAKNPWRKGPKTTKNGFTPIKPQKAGFPAAKQRKNAGANPSTISKHKNHRSFKPEISVVYLNSTKFITDFIKYRQLTAHSCFKALFSQISRRDRPHARTVFRPPHFRAQKFSPAREGKNRLQERYVQQPLPTLPPYQ